MTPFQELLYDERFEECDQMFEALKKERDEWAARASGFVNEEQIYGGTHKELYLKILAAEHALDGVVKKMAHTCRAIERRDEPFLMSQETCAWWNDYKKIAVE